jgi:hypothetical protein
MAADLDSNDLDCLAWVAEGRAARVPDEVAARLLAAGLITQFQRGPDGHPTLELTPAGLAHVRSSDQ